MPKEFDLRDAINGISDVVANRPSPLREFDQIYMKVADMVIQAHLISERFNGKNIIFMGDGDRSEERRVGKECRSRWSPYH